MNESEIRSLIRNEVKNMKAEIMMGFIVSNQDAQRSSVKRMSLEGEIKNIRNIQNYGISSRAPANTEALIIPVNGDPTHLNMAGHFDKNKPSVDDGELKAYDNFGNIIHLKDGEIKMITDKLAVLSSMIKLGSESSENPLVLGDLLMELLSDLIQLIAVHSHYGNLGFPTSAPINAGDFQSLKASPVNDGTLISDKSFTEK